MATLSRYRAREALADAASYSPFCLATILALLFSCTSETPPPELPELQLSVDSVPFIDIFDSTTTGEGAVFQYPRWATRRPNGGVVVADQYAARLLFFDEAGALVRSVGRRGEGPGEFGNVMWVDHCGTDSLFAWDATRRSVIVTDTVGRFVREFRPEGTPYELTCSPSQWFGVIGLPREYLAPSADGARAEAPLSVVDRIGRVRQIFADVPIGENRALGKLTRIAAGEDYLYVGTADSAWVDVYDLEGEKLRSIPIGEPRRSPTRANFERAVEDMVSLTPSERGQALQRPVYRALPMPAFLPPYHELLVDPEGMLWAVVSAPGDSTTDLRAVNSAGDLMFSVSLPTSLRLFEVGHDYILGRYMDNALRHHIVAYRIQRP